MARKHSEIVTAVNKMRDMIAKEVCDVELTHWSEGVFRYFFVRALVKNKRNLECDAEWRRVDLLIRADEENWLVEFKFFTTRFHESLDRKKRWPKGGPGQKNFREFCACLKKLALIEGEDWRREDDGPISGRYIVLAYCDRDGEVGYSNWYEHLERSPHVQAVAPVTRITTPKTVRCKASRQTLTITLLHVQDRQ